MLKLSSACIEGLNESFTFCFYCQERLQNVLDAVVEIQNVQPPGVKDSNVLAIYVKIDSMRARNPVDTCRKKTSGVLKKWNIAIGSVEPTPGDVLARVRRGKRAFGARTEDKLLLASVRGVLVALKILFSIHMYDHDTKVHGYEAKAWRVQKAQCALAAIPILTNGWFL